MVLYFQIHGLGSLQWQSELKPGQWLFNGDEQTRKRVGYIKHFDQIADVTDVHYKEFLTPFLNDILNEVAAEQSVSVDKICSDHVDDLVTEALQETSYKECFNDKCTATPEQKRSMPKNKINCPYCRKNLRLSHQEMVGLDSGSTYVLPKPRQQGTTSATKKSFRVQYDPDRETSHMEEVFSENQDHEPPSRSYLSEPVFVNPCSYKAVITILRNIGKKAGIKKYGTGIRKWITIYCDGSPFNLCQGDNEYIYLYNVWRICDGFSEDKNTYVSHTWNRHIWTAWISWSWVRLGHDVSRTRTCWNEHGAQCSWIVMVHLLGIYVQRVWFSQRKCP